MSFSDEQITALKAKLDPAHIQPPKQYGPKGSYIEGWFAIAEANRIFGFDAWSYEVVSMSCVAENPRQIGRDKKDGFGVTYTAHVRVHVDGVLREDVGAGHGYDVDVGLAHESAIKEAVTDALKRTLKSFGNPFGLALYDKSQANVGVDAAPKEEKKPISAAAMKRGLEDMQRELLDCRSSVDFVKCVNIWKNLMDRDGWTKDYREEAKKRFEQRREDIRAEMAEREAIQNEQEEEAA